jgi:hypothetical protein
MTTRAGRDRRSPAFAGWKQALCRSVHDALDHIIALMRICHHHYDDTNRRNQRRSASKNFRYVSWVTSGPLSIAKNCPRNFADVRGSQ